MDLGDLAIGAVAVLPLIIGIVEFSKKFFPDLGNLAILETFILAFAFGLLALVIQQGFIPEPYVTWVVMVVGALAFALGACGLYDWAKKLSGPKA